MYKICLDFSQQTHTYKQGSAGSDSGLMKKVSQNNKKTRRNQRWTNQHQHSPNNGFRWLWCWNGEVWWRVRWLRSLSGRLSSWWIVLPDWWCAGSGCGKQQSLHHQPFSMARLCSLPRPDPLLQPLTGNGERGGTRRSFSLRWEREHVREREGEALLCQPLLLMATVRSFLCQMSLKYNFYNF